LLYLYVQHIADQHIVGIQKLDELPRGEGKPPVASGRSALVFPCAPFDAVAKGANYVEALVC
jgi:hypothetical protein